MEERFQYVNMIIGRVDFDIPVDVFLSEIEFEFDCQIYKGKKLCTVYPVIYLDSPVTNNKHVLVKSLVEYFTEPYTIVTIQDCIFLMQNAYDRIIDHGKMQSEPIRNLVNNKDRLYEVIQRRVEEAYLIFSPLPPL